MTSLRPFRPEDLLRVGLTNLDPLTENYDIGFYSQYLHTWPSLFTVAEDANGNVIGYSEAPGAAAGHLKDASRLTNARSPSDGKGRGRPADPPVLRGVHALARPCHRSDGRASVPSDGLGSHPHGGSRARLRGAGRMVRGPFCSGR